MKKKILWSLLIIIVVIQAFRPEKNKSTMMAANDISKHYVVPENVTDILVRACNDCHSNNTYYPWYSEIQPVAWWLQSHVNDGKRHLNFSEFAAYEPKRQHHKLEELIEEVKENHMPLNSYLWIHKEAKLTNDEKEALLIWAGVLAEQIKLKHDLKQ